MTDKGTVVSTEKSFACVEVACLEACERCSASSLCIGPKNAKGLLSVKNPIDAQAGDRVLISIPEARYNKALILLFGVLLFATLAGMGLGYLASPLLPLSPSESSIIGVLLGIAVAGAFLSLRFRKINNTFLYPEITEILYNGGSYG